MSRAGHKVKARQYIEVVANFLSWVYVLERLFKLAAVVHFFGKQRPRDPEVWPSVTLLQPITRGASDLRGALDARARLDYPGEIQHLLVCDAADGESQAVCEEWIERNPGLNARIVSVEPAQAQSRASVASKIAKLQAGIALAVGEVVCCVDDDIILRPEALRVMLPYLYEPGAGAVFGLACYTEWSNLPSSLMSAFVNANALLTYVPGTYLTEPFTITGHIFALRRETLDEVGAFAGLENNAGDDHVLARKIRSMGLRAVQTPMIYDVENHLTGMADYAAQMKRWFVFPRQMMLPMLTFREKTVMFGLSAGNLIPGVLLLLTLLTRRRAPLKALGRSMVAFSAVYSLCEIVYLKRTTPLWRWPVVALAALVAPAQIVVALFSSNEVEWRGRRIRIDVGGDFTDVTSESR